MKSYSSGSIDLADEDWKADALWNHVLLRLRNESELKRRSLRESQHGHLTQGKDNSLDFAVFFYKNFLKRFRSAVASACDRLSHCQGFDPRRQNAVFSLPCGLT